MLPFFFARIALQEPSLLQERAEFGGVFGQGLTDGEFDRINLAGKTATGDADGDIEVGLFTGKSQRIGNFCQKCLIAR